MLREEIEERGNMVASVSAPMCLKERYRKREGVSDSNVKSCEVALRANNRPLWNFDVRETRRGRGSHAVHAFLINGELMEMIPAFTSAGEREAASTKPKKRARSIAQNRADIMSGGESQICTSQDVMTYGKLDTTNRIFHARRKFPEPKPLSIGYSI